MGLGPVTTLQTTSAKVLLFLLFVLLYFFFAIFFLNYFHSFAAFCEKKFLVELLKSSPLIELVGPQEDFPHLWEPRLP